MSSLPSLVSGPELVSIPLHIVKPQRRQCLLCLRKDDPPDEIDRPLGPLLIQATGPEWARVCPCPREAHVNCILNTVTDLHCETCQHIYHRKWRVLVAHIVCIASHVFSIGSAIGIAFGLVYLGRGLGQLGLGNEMNNKVDDDPWFDHELAVILQWLDLVYYATGFSGEALLGLVYIFGFCSVAGFDETLLMVNNTMSLDLSWCLNLRYPAWFNRGLAYVILGFIGLLLGTYLMFYTWIWACLFHQIRHAAFQQRGIKPNRDL